MESFQRQPELVAKPKLERKPRFPQQDILHSGRKEDIFIDPAAEAALILPHSGFSSSHAVIDAQVALSMFDARRAQEKSGSRVFFSSLYEHVLAWLSQVKKRFAKNSRMKARMTRHGERTLEQLRYLSQLCDATECRTPEEVLAAESAFGAAYFEIMRLSSELERMSAKEDGHHLKRYERHMSSLLRALD